MTQLAEAMATPAAEHCAGLEAGLREIAAQHAPVTLASSLGAEDMVLSDAILRLELPIEIFTLDTGRLHAQTLELIERVRQRYGYSLRIYRPQPQAVEEQVARHGLFAMYESVELRKACCHLRKVEPLHRALAGKAAWITGLRRAQAVTRAELPFQEFDSEHRLLKFNPLAQWSEAQVWDYLHRFQVPYNRLHDQGFRSIGCEPCTRAISADDDVRAGRWWWEDAAQKECGLHPRPLFVPPQPAPTA